MERRREILFRAKERQSASWVFGFYVMTIEDGIKIPCMICDNDLDYATDIDDSTLGEYTGMKDKNGVRVFEGDILKVTQIVDGGGIIENPIPSRDMYIVKWDLISWIWDKIGQGVCYKHFPDAWAKYDFEVVGNIYDNPEMLETMNRNA